MELNPLRDPKPVELKEEHYNDIVMATSHYVGGNID